MQTLPPLQRGDLLEVEWVDIYEDAVGDPDKAEIAHRVSFGLFWAMTASQGFDCLVTTTTVDKGDAHSSGYCCYPLAVVKNLKVVKPVTRRKRTAKAVAAE